MKIDVQIKYNSLHFQFDCLFLRKNRPTSEKYLTSLRISARIRNAIQRVPRRQVQIGEAAATVTSGIAPKRRVKACLDAMNRIANKLLA